MFAKSILFTIASSFAAVAARADVITNWQVAELMAKSVYADYRFTDVNPECVSFLQNEETPATFIFELRELHNETCGGDPQTMPRLMALGVNKADGSLLSDRNDELELRAVPAPNCGLVYDPTETDTSYPMYSVVLDDRTIFAPQSDGIVQAMMSPSGRKVLLSAGEVSLIDVVPNEYVYGAVVVNCVTKKIEGYLPNTPTLVTGFWPSETGFYTSVPTNN